MFPLCASSRLSTAVVPCSSGKLMTSIRPVSSSLTMATKNPAPPTPLRWWSAASTVKPCSACAMFSLPCSVRPLPMLRVSCLSHPQEAERVLPNVVVRRLPPYRVVQDFLQLPQPQCVRGRVVEALHQRVDDLRLLPVQGEHHPLNLDLPDLGRRNLFRLCHVSSSSRRCCLDGTVCPSSRQTPRHSAPQCRSEEHTSELQSRGHIVCRLLL